MSQIEFFYSFEIFWMVVIQNLVLAYWGFAGCAGAPISGSIGGLGARLVLGAVKQKQIDCKCYRCRGKFYTKNFKNFKTLKTFYTCTTVCSNRPVTSSFPGSAVICPTDKITGAVTVRIAVSFSNATRIRLCTA